GLQDRQWLALQLQRRVALHVEQAGEVRLDGRLDAGADEILRADASAGRRAVGRLRHDRRAGGRNLEGRPRYVRLVEILGDVGRAGLEGRRRQRVEGIAAEVEGRGKV